MASPTKTRRESSRESSKAPAEKHVRAPAEAPGEVRHLAVHTAHASLPIPYLTAGDVAANTRAVTGWLPPTQDLIYYGGLGALAIAGALEWPVALAVGGATWLVRSRTREPHELREPHEKKPPERTTATAS